MTGFQENLTSEAIGVITELVLVYFGVDLLLKRREKKRWQPARQAIVNQISKTYLAIFAAAHQIIRIDIHGKNLEEQFQSRNIYINMANHEVQRLQKTIDLNNAALDSFLMPLTAVLLEECDSLFDKLKFFCLAFSPQHQNFDVVSEMPSHEFNRIQNIINQLKPHYQESFKTPENFFGEDKLVQFWKEVEGKVQNLSFDLENFKPKGKRIPMVYDRNSLRKINPKNMVNGQPIHVFNTLD